MGNLITQGFGASGSSGGGTGVGAYTMFVSSPDATLGALSFKQHDNGIAVRETLRYPDGTPINLTGKTVKFHLKADGGNSVKVNATATIVWAEGGVAEYKLTSADLDTVGKFFREWEVTSTDGSIVTYPVVATLAVKVIPDLA